ncbi:MAG TPA: two-component system response regulator, partial [Clostridiales bacterium]|nr:two-component system response regulator [Clostridiales bacterium]
MNPEFALRVLCQSLERHNRKMRLLIPAGTHEISPTHMAAIEAMTRVVEARDHDIGHHIERIQKYVRLLAVRLKKSRRYLDQIDDQFIFDVYHASPLHDIGKIAIPDEILLKKGKLSKQEFDVMKTHTILGALNLLYIQELYPDNSFINAGIEITRSHHE